MNNSELGDQFNLIEKSKIKLMIGHKENRSILEDYLSGNYDIINSDLSSQNDKIDMLIVDEKEFQKNKEKIFKIKNSNNSLYLPLLLITRTLPKNIPDKYLKIIDEVVEVPIKKNILFSRIQNLLKVRTLFLSTQIYQKLTEKNPVGICILFENEKIEYINNTFLEIVDKNRKEVLKKDITKVLPEKAIKNKLSNNFKDKEDHEFTIELKVNEEKKWIDVRSSNINYKNIDIKLMILVDITAQKKSEEKIRYLSFHDQLTGLYNRDYFMEEIKRLDTERQLPLTLIMADINRLKLINDVYGHDRGDFLIKSAAKIMKDNLREEDILARIGGDEFAIILPKTTRERGREIINRINKKCNNFKKKGIIVSLALGLATKKNDEENIEAVLKKADDDMYKSKTSEGSKVREKIIDTINDKLKEKTDESKGHIAEMKKLADKFSKKINLNNSQKDRLLLLAETHDIGKVSLSNEIFKENKELSENEHEKLKEHTEYGYRICRSISKLNSIAEEILSHHERWDGKGYPRGIKEEEIPYLARIIAIIDSYLFLENTKNKGKKDIINELKDKAGNELDPQLTQNFIEMLD